jgi:hypothetical protein
MKNNKKRFKIMGHQQDKVADDCLRLRGVDEDASHPPRAKFARGPPP